MSTLKMTFWCQTNSKGIITNTAPIGKKFIGQKMENLIRWLKKQGGLRIEHV